MAVSRYNLTYLDRDGEAATVSVWGTALTAGNFTTQLGLAEALRDAIQDISLLALGKESLVATETKYDPVLPTHAYAERGIKFLVRARDTNGNAVTFKIPGPAKDQAGLMVGENVDLTSVNGAALVNAIEAFAKSNDGESITVLEIVYID